MDHRAPWVESWWLPNFDRRERETARVHPQLHCSWRPRCSSDCGKVVEEAKPVAAAAVATPEFGCKQMLQCSPTSPSIVPLKAPKYTPPSPASAYVTPPADDTAVADTAAAVVQCFAAAFADAGACQSCGCRCCC